MTPEDIKPFFSMDLSNGERLTFSSIDEIDNWTQTEETGFQFLTEGGGAAQANQLREAYVSGFQNIRQNLQGWRNNLNDNGSRENLANAIRTMYSSSHVVLLNSPFARIASDIAHSDGNVAASAALAALLGMNYAVTSETIKGAIRAALHKYGINPKSHDVIVKTLADLNQVDAKDRRTREAAFEALSQHAKSFIDDTSNVFKTVTADFNERTQEALTTLASEKEKALGSIKNTEASYKEHMTLRAPVDYWTDKAKMHRDAVKISRHWLIGFTSIGSLFLPSALYFLAITSAELAKGDAAVYIKFAVIGAIVTTVAFWVGRVLLRIYFSDRHLLTDAEERVAMIKTYLALSKDQDVTASERALVLAPIFRSAADGIVKEEGPDASLAGIIARLIDAKGVK